MKTRVLITNSAAVLLALTSVTACGSANGGGGNGSNPKITLTMYDWTNSSQTYLNFINNDVIAQFEKQHPNIKIVYDEMKDPSSTDEQQMTAGGGPDIVLMDGPSESMLYAKAGWLVPLNQYAKQYGWDKMYDSWALSTEQWKGSLYALPVEDEIITMYYNKSMFQKYGWKVPTNWNEFTSLMQSIQSKGIIPISFGDSDNAMENEWPASILMTAGLTRTQYRDVLMGKLPWNSPAVENAFNKYLYIWNQGWIQNKEAYAITDTDAINLFTSQKAAITLSGTWQVGSWMQQAPPTFQYGNMAMPGWFDGIAPSYPVGVGTTIGINAHSKHQAAAAEFINWFYSKQHIQQQLSTLAQLSPVQGLSVAGANPHLQDQYNELQAAFKEGNYGYTAYTQWSPDVDTYMWQHFEDIEIGKTSVSDFLNKLEQLQKQDDQKGLVLNIQ